MPVSGWPDRLERCTCVKLSAVKFPSAALATPALHRLNRTEYANAIRDLLALDVDVNVLLPADGSSQGSARRRGARARDTASQRRSHMLVGLSEPR
jgi:hypothetical protein